MMAKVQRVKKVELWSVWRILGVAAIAAPIAVVLMFAFAMAVNAAFGQSIGRWGDIGAFLLGTGGVVLLFGLPAVIIIRHHPQLRRWWHGFAFGATYGLGLVVIATLAVTALQYARGGWIRATSGLLPMMGPTGVVVSLVSGVLITCVWSASRGSRGKLIVTDNTFCPSCGYNLVGNTTYICSERGQPFTLEELEITAADLDPVQ